MQNVPLYFRTKQLVFGNGFVAGVEIVGRVTAVEEFGSVWIYGVNPGGIAESGDDLPSAYANFRVWFAKVLFDMAGMADDFADFRRTVDKYLRATDDESVAEWQAARKAIRAGNSPVWKTGMFRAERRDLSVQLVATDLTQEVESLSPELNCAPDSPVATVAA